MTLPSSLILRSDTILTTLGGLEVASEFFDQSALGKIALFNGYTLIVSPATTVLNDVTVPVPLYDLETLGYLPNTNFDLLDSNMEIVYSSTIAPITIEGRLIYAWGLDTNARNLLSNSPNCSVFYFHFTNATGPQLIQLIVQTTAAPAVIQPILDTWKIELGQTKCSTDNQLFIYCDADTTIYYNYGTVNDQIDVTTYPYLYGTNTASYPKGSVISIFIDKPIWFMLRSYVDCIVSSTVVLIGLNPQQVGLALEPLGYVQATDSIWLMSTGSELILTYSNDDIPTVTSVVERCFNYRNLGDVSGSHLSNLATYKQAVINDLTQVNAEYYYVNVGSNISSTTSGFSYKKLQFSKACGVRINSSAAVAETLTLNFDGVINITEAIFINICSDILQLSGITINPWNSRVRWTQLSGRPLTFDDDRSLNPLLSGFNGGTNVEETIVLQIASGPDVKTITVNTKPIDTVKTKYSELHSSEYSDTQAVNMNILFAILTGLPIVEDDIELAAAGLFTFNLPNASYTIEKFGLLLNVTGDYEEVQQTTAELKTFTATVLPAHYKIRAYYNINGIGYYKDSDIRYLRATDFGTSYLGGSYLRSKYSILSTSSGGSVAYVYSAALTALSYDDTVLTQYSGVYTSGQVVIPYVYNSDKIVIDSSYDSQLLQQLLTKYSSLYVSRGTAISYQYNRSGLVIG